MVFISQTHKQCTKCNEIKSIDNFHKRNDKKDGLSTQCKHCKSSIDKQYRELNKDKIKQDKKKYYNENKETIDITKKEYQQKNKELIKKYQKEYREKNKDTIKEYNKKYRETNRETIKQSKKKYYAENMAKTDNIFALIHKIRKRIYKVFLYKNYPKISKTIDIIGCNFEEFKIYIESQFTEGMNWDNRNDWHLDHIVPVSFGETEEEIIMLNHYTNFRPLLVKDNLSKHAKLTEESLNHPIYKTIIEQRSNNPN